MTNLQILMAFFLSWPFGLRKNGEEFPMLLQARNVPYRGKMVRAVEFSDITEQKQNELTREKLQIELTHAQKMESVERLAGGLAHDFNNMLGVILGYSELILDQKTICKKRSCLYDKEYIEENFWLNHNTRGDESHSMLCLFVV